MIKKENEELKGNLLSKFIDRFNDNYLDFNTECLTKTEKIKYNIPNNISYVSYNDIKDKLELRKKNLNKTRGETTRL